MSKRNLYAFLISFIMLLAVIILNRLSFQNVRSYSDAVDNTRQVITVLGNISNHFKSAQIYSPRYNHILQKDFYELYKSDAVKIRGELEVLKLLVFDNPEQYRMADSLQLMINLELDTLLNYDISEIIESGQGYRLYKYFIIHDLINKGIEREEALLMERNKKLKAYTRNNNLLTTAFGVVGVGILLYTFISIFFLSRKSRWLEGFLESILNTSQNGIVHYKAIWNDGEITDFKIEFINKALNKVLKLHSQQLIGKLISELPEAIREKGLFDKYVQVVETGKPIQVENQYTIEGKNVWFMISLARLEDGVTATFHNITEIKMYEEELKENIKELERSNSELEQYAYAASHDLQEPLRKIRAFGSVLQDTQSEKLDEKGQQQLKKILSAAERMSSLIKDILSFSSVRKEEHFIETDLTTVIEGVMQDLDLVITQKNAHIIYDNLPVIKAIPLQMNQLFYNLLNNSLKFAKQDQRAEVEIRCRKLNENERPPSLEKLTYYEIIIKDNGIGFKQEYVDQIFGLFKRLNDKQYYPGSGIGLALCRKVVDNHHGYIRAEGRENEGAAFYIYLPEQQP